MADYRTATVHAFLDALEYFERSGSWRPGPEIGKMLQSHLGLPCTSIDRILANPFVVEQALVSLWNSRFRPADEESALLHRFHRLTYEISKSHDYFRLRLFDPLYSSFTGSEFFKRDVAYIICDDIPVLIVRELPAWLLEARPGGNELNWITRPELRALLALSFGADSRYKIFKTLEQAIDSKIDRLAFNPFIPENREKIIELVRFLKRILTEDDPLRAIFAGRYNFDTGVSTERVSRLYDSFDLDSRLHLRTALHFIKAAALLWGSSQFAEEAFMNMYFGLEGVLRMIHHKRYPEKQFEIKETLSYIEQEFPNKMLSEEITDFYEHRVELVHPEPDFEADWERFSFSDDLHDSFEMLRSLLVFAFCGEKLPV